MEQAQEFLELFDVEERLIQCVFAAPDIFDGSEAIMSGMEELVVPGPPLRSFLEPYYFQAMRFSSIFKAQRALYEEGQSVTDLTVIDVLTHWGKLDEAGGKEFIKQVYAEWISPHEYYALAAIIRREWGERRKMAVMAELGPAITSGDLEKSDKLRDDLDKLDAILNKRDQGLTDTEDIGELLLQWYSDPTEVRGYTTGIRELDVAMGGLDKGELLILLGYTGSGKSTLMMQFAFEFCKQGPGLIVPTEMTVAQWKLRMVAYELGADYLDLYLGRYRNLKALLECAKYINDLPISWFKEGSPTPRQINRLVKLLDRQKRCDWVIVDGVNDIVVPGADGGPDKTSQAISCLHGLARSGKIVACTAHMNRDSKSRGNKAPNPRDAFGSSRVEQLATRILTIWRPGHMVETGEAEEMPDSTDDPRLAHIKLAKSRFTETGKVVDLFFAKHDGRHGFHPVDKREIDFTGYNR